MLYRSVKHPSLIHLPASNDTCRLWEEGQREDGTVWSIKFSEDGSLLVVIQEDSLEMWKTSTWEALVVSTMRGKLYRFLT